MVQYWVIIYFLAEIYKEQADRQIYFVRYLPVNCYKKLEENRNLSIDGQRDGTMNGSSPYLNLSW